MLERRLRSFSSRSSNKWAITTAGHFTSPNDSTYDIGQSGSERPRDLFLGRNLAVASTASIGSTAQTNTLLWMSGTGLLSGGSQYGIYLQPTFSSAATTNAYTLIASYRSAAATYTTPTAAALYVTYAAFGAGNTISNFYGLYIANQGTAAVTNLYGIYIDAQSGATSTNVGLYAKGTYAAKFEGQVIIDNGFGFGYDASKGLITAFNLSSGADVTGWYSRIQGGKNQSSSIYAVTTQATVDGAGAPFTLNWVGGTYVTSLYGYANNAPNNVTITNRVGIRIGNQAGGTGGGGAMTNSYGLYVDSQGSNGTVNSYGIWIGTPSGSTGNNIGLYNAGRTRLDNHLDWNTDNTYDIGQSGSNRPRNLYLSGSVVANFVGVGAAPTGTSAIYIVSTTTNGVIQYGIFTQPTFTSSATTAAYCLYVVPALLAATFTTTSLAAIMIGTPSLGAGSVASNNWGVYVTNQGGVGRTTTYGIYIAAQSGSATTNVGLYNAGTSLFASYMDVAEIATPGTPSAGYVRMYAKSDHNLYMKGNDGVEHMLNQDRALRTYILKIMGTIDPSGPPAVV
jgi:hypothetical protein